MDWRRKYKPSLIRILIFDKKVTLIIMNRFESDKKWQNLTHNTDFTEGYKNG